MTRSDHDPLPGDFDAELADIDSADVQVVEASRDRRLVVQVTLGPEDAEALQRIADGRGQTPSEALSSLIRAASAKAA
jgi:hypothetical protein